ncbi:MULTISPECIES: hypothetical protein [unclassified Saccharopolyspora]|uniref:hypothetical protein n=1 Tax=unclassified Saccharopolyspora TaxID=2646250 RepID=UPI001CD46A9B|nr:MULTISPECIES: hypothetical protein [unclassified Saccharopolyspora]MCA1226158.1 hypothetical protein [Saccharopolyspora sp. 6M]MCA1282767.1 hypothetical protein [Saccharopolyspora sp. 7B]
MSDESRSLAVLLRQAQWALDDAAFDIGAGRATTDQREQLASALIALARALHGDERPLIIDVRG